MKSFSILGGKAMIVELPEGATDVGIEKDLYLSGPVVLWYMPGKNGVVNEVGSIDLLPGNWRIIGMLSEVTEEQVAGIVAKHYSSLGYDDYLHDVDFSVLDTALESLDSAILAEGYAWNNPVPKPDCDCITEYDREGCDQECWKHINTQSRVLCRSRCLLLGRV